MLTRDKLSKLEWGLRDMQDGVPKTIKVVIRIKGKYELVGVISHCRTLEALQPKMGHLKSITRSYIWDLHINDKIGGLKMVYCR